MHPTLPHTANGTLPPLQVSLCYGHFILSHDIPPLCSTDPAPSSKSQLSGVGDGAQLVECLPRMHEALTEPNILAWWQHSWNLSIWKVEAGGL